MSLKTWACGLIDICGGQCVTGEAVRKARGMGRKGGMCE